MTHPDGAKETFTWDAHGNRLAQVDARGVRGEYRYDGKGNRIGTTEAVGSEDERSVEQVLDAHGQPLSETRTGAVGEAVETRYTYDAFGNVETRTAPDTGAETYSHDVQGNVLTRTDALNRTWTSTYDATGNLLTETDPLGHTTTHVFDDVGNRIETTDPLGHKTVYGYDPLDRLTSVTDPEGHTRTFGYDGDGRMTFEADPLGRVTRLEYDAMGRLTRITDPAGRETRYHSGDAQGNAGPFDLAEVEYPTYRETYRYDARGRHVEVAQHLPDGRVLIRTSGFDAAGNLTSEGDSAGRTTTYRYDSLGRLQEAEDPAGGVTRYGYDHRGNRILVVNAREIGVRTSVYDGADRLTEEHLPTGQILRTSYDPAGQVAARTDAKGQTTRYRHDEAGRLIGMDYYEAGADPDAPGAVPAKTVTYVYDAAGHLAAHDDGSTRTEIQRDKNDRQTTTIVHFGPFSASYTYRYAADDRKSALVYPDGREMRFHYDSAGQLERIGLPAGGDMTYADYREAGRPGRTGYPGGSASASTTSTGSGFSTSPTSTIRPGTSSAGRDRMDARSTPTTSSIASPGLAMRPSRTSTTPTTASATA